MNNLQTLFPIPMTIIPLTICAAMQPSDGLQVDTAAFWCNFDAVSSVTPKFFRIFWIGCQIAAAAPDDAARLFRHCWRNQPTAMPRRNSMLLPVFLSLPSSSSMASTGGTPVRARRRMTTLLYSSG